MKIELDSVWVSEKGFAIRIVKNMGGNLYLYNPVDGSGCGGYVWARCLIKRFTRLGAQA